MIADSPFSTCCPDYMSAHHISATCLIHFGYKCSSYSGIPVLHIPEPVAIDPSILEAVLPMLGKKVFIFGTSASGTSLCEDYLISKDIQITDRSTAESVLFIGNGCAPLSIVQSPEQNVFILTDKCECINSYSYISKRYHFISMVSESQVFGIIISNLSVYNNVEKRLKGLLRKFGKVGYPIYLGKITALKLGNFREIDLFVTVSCENADLPDNKEFFRPVITLFELEVGLRGNWQGKYSSEFVGEEFEGDNEERGVGERFMEREFKGLEVGYEGSVEVEDGYSGIPMCYKSELPNN